MTDDPPTDALPNGSLTPREQELVQTGARIGAQDAIDSNKLRLRVYSGLIGALVASAICLPVTIILAQDARTQAAHQVTAARVFAASQTRSLCHQQRHVTILGNQTRFALRELLSFDADILQAATHPAGHPASKASITFLHVETERLVRDLVVERRVTPGLPAHVASFSQLLPLLNDLPLTRCGR